MERWFTEHCMPNLSKTTLSKYSEAIERLKSTGVYELPIKRVTQQTLTAAILAMQGGSYSGQPIAKNSAIRHTEPLRFALSWAEKQRLIQYNPLHNAHLPPMQKRKHRILSMEDIDIITARINGHAFKIPILLALYGGLRREEVAALKWGSVDLQKNSVTITEAHTRGSNGQRIIKDDTKTPHSNRTVSLPKFVMAELAAVKKTGIYVCVNRSGNPLELSGYPQAIRRIIAQINTEREGTNISPMPQATFHDLRHTHAAMLIKMGIQPKVIQERMGHASIKITMDTYGYLMPGLQESVAARLDEEFENRSSYPAETTEFHAQTSGHKSGHTHPQKPSNMGTNKVISEIPKLRKAK